VRGLADGVASVRLSARLSARTTAAAGVWVAAAASAARTTAAGSRRRTILYLLAAPVAGQSAKRARHPLAAAPDLRDGTGYMEVAL